MKTPKEKYLHDPPFNAIVNTMIAHIEAAKFTPSEMREATILASIMYEENHIRERQILSPEIEEKFKGLYEWVNIPAPHNKSMNRGYPERRKEMP